YQQGVGATEDHELSNNLLYGGALQHQKKAAWSGKMTWLDEMESTEYYNADDYYIGVYTSDQFTQSEGSGMELLSATTTLLAGVYLAEDLTDERENAVGVASQIHAADVAEAAARQAADEAETAARQAADTAEASTRAEADTALDEKIDALAEKVYTQSEVDALLSDLSSSLTSTLKAWVTAQGYTSLSAVNSLLGNYVKTTETVTEIQALTTEEFNNLTDRNDTTLYLN
ncbi:MAG: hypothetical protein LUE08_06960, partial [Akkermansiaceae bacterium]|nr:hypothetical protein [Akkermansiaceae bacterium]